MNGMNHVTLVGRVAGDPVAKTSKNGEPYFVVNVKTERPWKNKDGLAGKWVDYHRVLLFSPLSKKYSDSISKGAAVCIEGHLSTYSFNHGEERRSITSVTADEVRFLDKFELSEKDETRLN